jgi:hypothetical protein
MALDPLLLLHARALQIVDEYVAIHEEVLQFSLRGDSHQLHGNAGQLEVLAWRLGDVADRVPAATAEEPHRLRKEFGSELAAYTKQVAHTCLILSRLATVKGEKAVGAKPGADEPQLRKEYAKQSDLCVQRRLALDELHLVLMHRGRPARA